jgi:hypothetical protein
MLIPRFQTAVCSILLFYACLIIFIVLVTPSRIAQFMYDLTQGIRRIPYGSFIIMAVVGAPFHVTLPLVLLNMCSPDFIPSFHWLYNAHESLWFHLWYARIHSRGNLHYWRLDRRLRGFALSF